MRALALTATVAAAALSLVLASAVAVSGAALSGDDSRDGTTLRHVTEISGSREHGFHVSWSDGDEWWTPTLSEALAECGEYHRAVRGTRCATRARTAHRWMGILKRSLRHHR